jgi:hypothetical protein
MNSESGNPMRKPGYDLTHPPRRDGLVSPPDQLRPSWMADKNTDEYYSGRVPPSDDIFKSEVISLLKAISLHTYNSALYEPRMRIASQEATRRQEGGRRKTRRHKKTRRHR